MEKSKEKEILISLENLETYTEQLEIKSIKVSDETKFEPLEKNTK